MMTIEIIIASKGEGNIENAEYTDLTRGDGDERADER